MPASCEVNFFFVVFVVCQFLSMVATCVLRADCCPSQTPFRNSNLRFQCCATNGDSHRLHVEQAVVEAEVAANHLQLGPTRTRTTLRARLSLDTTTCCRRPPSVHTLASRSVAADAGGYCSSRAVAKMRTENNCEGFNRLGYFVSFFAANTALEDPFGSHGTPSLAGILELLQKHSGNAGFAFKEACAYLNVKGCAKRFHPATDAHLDAFIAFLGHDLESVHENCVKLADAACSLRPPSNFTVSHCARTRGQKRFLVTTIPKSRRMEIES